MNIKKFKNKTVAFISSEPIGVREKLEAIKKSPKLANAFEFNPEKQNNEDYTEVSEVAG